MEQDPTKEQVAALVADYASKRLSTQAAQISSQFPLEQGIFAAICIVAGLTLCILGKRIFKLFLGLTGFLGGAFIAFLALGIVGLQPTAGSWGLWAVVLFSGLFLMLVCLFTWQVAVYLVGALGGFLAGLILCNVLPESLVERVFVRVVMCLIGTGLGLVYVYKYDELVIAITTAITGALSTTVGADFYLKTDFRERIVEMLTSRKIDVLMNKGNYAMLALTVAFAVSGLVLQLTVNSKGLKREK